MRTAGRKRTEGYAPVILLLKICNKVACVALGFYKNILHSAAEGIFYCGFIFARNIDNLRKHAQNLMSYIGIILSVAHKVSYGILIGGIFLLIVDSNLKSFLRGGNLFVFKRYFVKQSVCTLLRLELCRVAFVVLVYKLALMLLAVFDLCVEY